MSYALAFALIISVSVSAFQLWQSRKDEAQRVGKFLEQLIASSEANLADVVWEDDRKSARQIAEKISNSTDVTYFLIRSNDAVLVELGAASKTMIQRSMALSSRRGERVPNAFGQFTVGVEMTPIYDRLNSEYGEILARTTLLTFLVIGFVLYLFKTMVTRHLSQISHYFASLTADTLEQHLELSRLPSMPGQGDEFDDLVAGVNKMQTNLASDIRRRELAEAEVRQLNEMLEERVAQRTSELQTSNLALEESLNELRTAQTQLIQSEKMASLGQLMASVAHEINTPIGAVKSSGRTIADSLDETLEALPRLLVLLDEENRKRFMNLINVAKGRHESLSTRDQRAGIRALDQKLSDLGVEDSRHKADILVQLNAQSAIDDCLPLLRHPDAELILNTAQSLATIINGARNINTAVDRVSKIIFALKSFSRMDNTGEMISSNLSDGVETVLTIYQSQIRQGTELVRQFDDIPPILCLPDELNQVWTNLIHNALQAMNHKGTLTVRIRQKRAESGDFAIVSVGDNGCGIPEEIRSKIFDVFFTTKPAGEGSGLGLDIVKKIIDKHKGRIDVHSEVNVGTTFSVYLPYPIVPS